jgi:hypothetical protein
LFNKYKNGGEIFQRGGKARQIKDDHKKWLKSIVIVRVYKEVMRLLIYYAPAALKGWGLNLSRIS